MAFEQVTEASAFDPAKEVSGNILNVGGNYGKYRNNKKSAHQRLR
jgi:hypothetical protein